MNKIIILGLFIFVSFSGLKAQTAEDLYYLGKIEINNSNFNKAIEYFTQAINLNNRYEMAYFQRGRARFNQKQYIQSITDFTISTLLGYEKVKSYCNIGAAYYNIGKYEESLIYLSKSLKTDPNFSKALYLRGLYYYQTSKLILSCNDMQKAADLGSEEAKEFLLKYCK